MLRCERLIHECRAAQFAAPIPLTPRGPRWPDWEVKEMVWLRQQGYTAKQIAFRLKRSKNAVEKQLYRVRHGKRRVK